MNKKEPSLLKHFNEIRDHFLQEGGLSTVILCGQMSNIDLVLGQHRSIVEEEVNTEEVNVTGLLVAQGDCFLHLLEGPCNSILRILSKFSINDKNAESSVRVLYSVEDRPKRYFPEWYSCIIEERSAYIEEITEDNCVDMVHDLAMKLLEVGVALQTASQGEVELNEYADFLPPKDLVLAFSNSQLFFPLTEYVKVYASPLHLFLESESVWPLEQLVSY